MPDRRYNDIACNLRTLAQTLEKQARDHRLLAEKLDYIVANPALDQKAPAHLAALDAAALQLVDLPASDIRKQAPAVARASNQDVFSVAIRAQQIRRDRMTTKRRRQTVAIMTALASGQTLKRAAKTVGVSEATARRLRDGWADQTVKSV